ncbi:hypothetical protein [Mucilaginibacter sp. OK098]|uniref:hypothetical protein n=1 Tax=Mucilaginibacter sp. OK098 TaxID=1855297 RepID=UPI00090ED7C0|nr:hypothetical protein [Mucilaginibacter sp. OK098]SHM80709.1 hypothetical protein SAMN05216524_103479 [Mucilaginibacter sp. OK098]
MAETQISRAELLAYYDQLVAVHPHAVLKGDTMPYTSLNGHMYSYFTKDNFLALRLPEAEIEKFLAQYQTTLVQQYGIIQKQYVSVPGGLLQKTDELLYWFAMSYAYVSTLKPKLTAKKKD